MREVLGERIYQRVRGHVAQALAGHSVDYEMLASLPNGVDRFVEVSYIPDVADDGEVRGFIALVSDVSERKRVEAAREANARRNERLMRITAAIAEAVTLDRVFEAVVDQAAAALDAS